MTTPNRNYAELSPWQAPDVPFHVNRTINQIDADVQSVADDLTTTGNRLSGDIDAATTRANQAYSTATNAATTATEAADTVEGLTGPWESRLSAVETLGGLAPGDVSDATVGSLMTQEGTVTRDALIAAIAEPLDERVAVQDKVRQGDPPTENQFSVMLAPNVHDGIAPRVEGSVILNPGNTKGMNNVIGGDGSQTVGTSTPNVVGDGSIQANISVIGGYDNVAGAVSSKIISDHSYTAVPEAGRGLGHHGIFGGQGHVAGPRAGHAGIIGGDQVTVNSHASVAGGLTNTTEGDYSIIAGNSNRIERTGNNSAVFGTRNVAEGLNSLVGGLDNTTGPLVRGGFVAGENNVVTGMGGVATGRDNIARAAYSRVAGRSAEANTDYEDAYGATGFGSQVGSAQRSTIILSRQSTDAANGNLAAIVPNGASWAFEAQVVAVDEATQDTAAWTVAGAIKGLSTANAPLVGTPTITRIAADTGAEAWTVTITDTWAATGKLVIVTKGEADKIIRWVCTINITQVKTPGPDLTAG